MAARDTKRLRLATAQEGQPSAETIAEILRADRGQPLLRLLEPAFCRLCRGVSLDVAEQRRPMRATRPGHRAEVLPHCLAPATRRIERFALIVPKQHMAC